MEFRQVVHTVCRSAAAATRPSLASTRPSPAGMLFLQHHRFTTDSKKQLEAAAAASSAAAAQPQSPPPVRSGQARVAQLRASLAQSHMQSSTPPRPPPFRSSDAFGNTENKGRSPSWTTPQGQPSRIGGSSTTTTTLTGKAPSSGNGGGGGGLFNLDSQINADMQRSTGLSTWVETDFFANNQYTAVEPELRLRPSTGRTVHVKGNVDLARGFSLLQRSVTQNGLRRAVRLARSYERPALKRKRQKRERWANRFKNGFRATIARAMELKAQGW
ncbi:hypothetical protein C8A00DRAFT_35165 [Chaetomidium leptoderma]|uniref:Ribosomal protein S21 n=1 Tax=Chaetomidium leptoderma TaxID=669021 RepID=A0AAN6VJT1_9PEZI|nr:hypothetical protein C8A00DRAFT_35165 [Chaetomidium leptoderma]